MADQLFPEGPPAAYDAPSAASGQTSPAPGPSGGGGLFPEGPPAAYDAPSGTPGGTTGVDHPQLGWSDIPGALTAGMRQGFGDVGQTFEALKGSGADSAGPQSPAAAPYEWSDIVHPGSALAKTAYRLGEGSPTIAAGVAGGVGGEAVAGPVGGLAGGALGAAGGSALQTLGPEFAHQIKKTPDDPDGAFQRAMQSAAVSGAFSGAAWGLFPAKFFQGPVKNALFQIFGVQPGLSVGHEAAQAVQEGRPETWKDIGRAYTEGAVGTAAPMAGTAAARGIAHRLMPNGSAAAEAASAKDSVPTAADLKATSDAHFQDLGKVRSDDGGAVRATYDVGALTEQKQRMADSLLDAGAHPDDQPKLFRAIDSLDTPRREGDVSIKDIIRTRTRLAGALSDRDPATSHYARMAVDQLDGWLSDPERQIAAGVAPEAAHNVASVAKTASDYWRTAKSAEAWQDVQDRIDNSHDPEKTRRAEINRIVSTPELREQYPPEAVRLMQEALNEKSFKGWLSDFARKVAPHSPTDLMMGYLMSHHVGPIAIGAQMAAWVLGRMHASKLHALPESVHREVTGKRLPTNPGILGRTDQGFSPYQSRIPVGPGAGQDQTADQGHASGGVAGGDRDPYDAESLLKDYTIRKGMSTVVAARKRKAAGGTVVNKAAKLPTDGNRMQITHQLDYAEATKRVDWRPDSKK